MAIRHLQFGAMMAAEAGSRGFFTPPNRAFLGDGLPYNWAVEKRWFADFAPTMGFIRVVEYLYNTARNVPPCRVRTSVVGWDAGDLWEQLLLSRAPTSSQSAAYRAGTDTRTSRPSSFPACLVASR